MRKQNSENFYVELAKVLSGIDDSEDNIEKNAYHFVGNNNELVEY